MAQILAAIKKVWLRCRLKRALFHLCDRAARLDWAVYGSDLEAGDEVARSVRRARRRATVFAAALQTLNQPQGPRQ